MPEARVGDYTDECGGLCFDVRALSTRNDDPLHASQPFDAERDGFVIGEGAGILILEELEHAKRRGAKIYAELVGYGMAADAFHLTMPDETGSGARRVMQKTIKDAASSQSRLAISTHTARRHPITISLRPSQSKILRRACVQAGC